MTTICSVRYNNKTAIAGDGQVTLGEKVIAKATAKKIRRIYHVQIVMEPRWQQASVYTT